MSENTELIIGIGVLILVFVLSRKFHAWKINRAYIFIIEDLKAQGAFDSASAVDLSYARNAMFRLISNNIVGTTTDDHYYLKDKTMNLSQN
jgi:hypothetical protein